jgi:hypothetical protein
LDLIAMLEPQIRPVFGPHGDPLSHRFRCGPVSPVSQIPRPRGMRCCRSP